MNKETMQKLQELGTESDKLFQEKRWGAAIPKLDEMVALLADNKAKAAVLNNRGNAKSRIGDHAGAIADLDWAIAINPQDADAYCNRGNVKNKMGDYTGAITDIDRAIAINPKTAKAYSNRGITKDKLGDLKGAIADFDRAIAIDPEYADAYGNRGNAKDKLGDYKGAIADHDRAIAIDPLYANAYNSRGNAKDKLGDYKDAVADFDRAIAIDPQYADAYCNRGDTKRKMDDHAGSIADLDQAIAIDPQLAEAYNNRGATKSTMGNYKDAIADYDQALKIDPGDETATRNRTAALVLQASQKRHDEIEEKYQAQLQAQQEKFDRDMQEQLRTQQEKLDAKFQAEYQAAEDIALPLGYSDNFNEYDTKARLCGVWVWALSFVLAVAAIVVFGSIAYLGVEQLQECEQPCKKEAFSALSLFPFILMGTLVLSPLAWVIRMLNRDKHKYWALREDARANLTLAKIITSNPALRKELSESLFDHHDKRGSANLIADWNRADTDNSNSVSVQDILSILNSGK